MRWLATVCVTCLAGLLSAGCTGDAGDGVAKESSQIDLALQTVGDTPKEITNSIGMKLMPIPKGTFMMGERDRAQHQVTLTQPFYLGVYEVTQQQYEQVMNRTPSYFDNDRVEADSSNHPVEQVSWNDAVDFCQRLSELPDEKAAGRVYRLPTEAEWEYACRAGTQTAYGFGDDARQLGEYAWFRDNSDNKTHAVGQKKANAWGLYDMHGNVLEWCSDWYEEYPQEPVTDPSGPSWPPMQAAEGALRVCRGGSWGTVEQICRSSFRNRDNPLFLRGYRNYGFRVAMSPSNVGETEATPQREAVPENAATIHDTEPEVPPDETINQDSVSNSIGMKFAQVPAGTLTMREGDNDQGSLIKAFHIGVYEVTQEQYERVIGRNPSFFKGPRNPVEMVSWEDAVEFCQRLSELPEERAAGRVYRLPTEAEWEYACRAGTQTAYSFGDDEGQLGEYAWFRDNSDGKTQAVGQKKANAWGLFDMHGNVLEWCSEWDSRKSPQETVTEPTGPSVGSGHVARGGGWAHTAEICQSANRDAFILWYRGPIGGFRAVMSSSGIPE